MTQKELAGRLVGIGLPVAYLAFRTRQTPPYVCYLYTYDTKFFADDTVYFSVGHYQVELYTSVKSPDAEALVEGALSGLCWEKSETYLDSERLYQILYEIEV